VQPVLFEIPGLGYKMYAFGLLFGLGYLVAIGVAAWVGKRWQGLPTDISVNLGIICFLGGVVGAWIFQAGVEILSHGRGTEAIVAKSPIGGGAGVFYGGVVVATLALYAYTRFRGLYWWHNVDIVFCVVPLGLAFGRVGCFLAGCCWGKACDLPWAVTFPKATEQMKGTPSGVPLHPAQLYAVGAALLVFALLVVVLRWKRFGGQVMLSFFIAYGVARFLLEMVRDDPRGFFPGGLSTSQGFSILFVAGALALWPVLRRRGLPDSPFRDARKKRA